MAAVIDKKQADVGSESIARAMMHVPSSSDLALARDDLEDVDLREPIPTFERDFCCNFALIISAEYSPLKKIKEYIAQILNTKRKKEFISLTMRLFNETYINYTLKKQFSSVVSTLRAHDSSQIYTSRELEDRCIKVFAKLPSHLDGILEVRKEFIEFFRTLRDIEFAPLNYRFGMTFIDSLYRTVIKISSDPIKYGPIILKTSDDKVLSLLASITQQMMYAIKNIRSALQTVFDEGRYTILKATSSPASPPTSDELDPFLVSYLREILGEQGKLCHEERALFQNQCIRIPQLISAVKEMRQHLPEEASEDRKKTADEILSPHFYEGSPMVRTQSSQALTIPASVIVMHKFSRRRRCLFAKQEEHAALFDRLPLLEAINDSITIDRSIIRFARLYPGSIKDIGPYLIWMELATNFLGVLSARDAIVNPNENRLTTRIWKVVTNGAVFYIFSLGAAINLYLLKNPKTMNITTEEFYTKIASGPAAFSLVQIIWNMIPSLLKERLFPRDTRYHYLRQFLDVFNKSIYDGGIIYFSISTLYSYMKKDLPKDIYDQLLIPLSTGFVLALFQVFSSCKDTFNTFLTYLTFAANMTYFVKLLSPTLLETDDRDLKEFDRPLWQFCLRTIYFGGLTGYSLYLFVKNYNNFVKNYIHEDEVAQIIIKQLPLPVVDGVADTSSLRPDEIFISMQERQALERSMVGGRHEEARGKVIYFSKRAKQLGKINKADFEKTLLAQEDAEYKERKQGLGYTARDLEAAESPARSDDNLLEDFEDEERQTFCDRCSIL